ncbi:MAG: HD domain-containing protein [Crenarchaeota archaeon]|nr:HD domain-containing protein [Thermoproteota archaeon]
MSTHRIISYYSSSERGRGRVIEYLTDHIDEMIDLIDEESKTISYGTKLYNDYKVLMEREGIMFEYGYADIVYTAIIFHDVGKALHYPRVINAMKHNGYVSFAGHEAFSAILLEELARKLSIEKPENYSVEAIMPAMFAILYHHHSLVLGKRLERLGSTIKKMDNNTITLIIDLIKNDLGRYKHKSSLIDALLDNLEEPIHRTIEKLRLNPSYAVNELDEKLKRKIASGKKRDILLKKLMHLTLTTLIALDYEAARRIRGGTPTIFGKMCTEWLNHYIKRTRQKHN